MNQRHRKSRGFTLVELVVAMVVAAILVSIAVPGYMSYVRKARRTDAKNALLALASLEERYYSTSNVYSSTPSDLGFATASTWPQTVGSGYYTVTVSNVNAATSTTAATYNITATAIGDEANDAQCLTFTVIQNGTQSATPDPTNTCWR